MTTTVVPIELGEVHLPDWHPRAAVGTALLPGFVVRHPDGVIVSTPGHTPGHQCAVDLTDVHDGPWLDVERTSLDRLHALELDVAHFSRDRTVCRRRR